MDHVKLGVKREDDVDVACAKLLRSGLLWTSREPRTIIALDFILAKFMTLQLQRPLITPLSLYGSLLVLVNFTV
jgi:hypothetical protein